MNETDYPAVGEHLVRTTLANGLRLFMVPKPAYHETYALLSVDYGSVDTTYVPVGSSDQVTDPAGIAHFLEHKLFEKEDHDAFDLFGQTGASANAFTGTTRTSYLFSATEQIDTNLTTLLDFVQDPFFSDQTVAKEKGIIGQEIQMYQDDPSWQLYFGLIGNLYPGQPVAEDVTGSLASIDQITPALLYQAYQTFYQPSNMTLTVAGPIDPDHIAELVAANQAQKHFAPATPLQRAAQFDGDTAKILPYRANHMNLVRPKSVVGIKGQQFIGDDAAGTKQQITVQLLLEMLFGDSSPLYQQWYDSGVIDDSFDYDFTAQRPYNFITMGGETSDPEGLSAKLVALIGKGAGQSEFSTERFDRLQKAALGKYYQSLNSLERIANQTSSQSFSDVTLFDYGELLRQVTLADVKETAATFFDPAALSVYHLLPEATE